MQIIAIHFDPPFIKVCLIAKGRSSVEIVSLKSAPPNDVKLLYIKNFHGRVASALPAKDFLIRSLELQGISGRHAEEAIAFQAETASHLKPEEVITVSLFGKKETRLIMADKSALRRHLDELNKLDIDPDAISTIPSALCHFACWKFPHLSNALLLEIGSQDTTCVWMENGELKKAHSIAIGVETLIAALFEDRKKVLLRKEMESAAKQIDLLLLKPGLNPHLTGALTELRQEIGRIFYAFAREEKRPVIVTGRTDAFIHLKEFLVGETEHNLTQEEQLFGVAIGTALEQTSPYAIQLRRGEFFPEKNWRKIGMYATFLLAASCLCSALLVGFGLWSSHAKKSEMASRFHLEKGGKVEEQIDRWIASVEANNKEYPYLLQAPKAAETLAWFSSHPLLEQMKQEADPIDLKEMHYELVKFPKIDSLKEAYLAKVEMEFQFKNAINARKFHDALREDPFIDAGKEISWEVLDGGYRASFFLKNRSAHVL